PSLDDVPPPPAARAADAQAQLAADGGAAAFAAAPIGRCRASARKARRVDELERIVDADLDEQIVALAALLGGRAARGRADVATLLREARERFRDMLDLLRAPRAPRRRRRLAAEFVDALERAIDELRA
ncbi:HrpJ domain-containing protein, partial [Burkholderia pseudomallei]|uniref:HrpJ domain-containing protein n=1 Tax=Burkholderia pseudomallei TaxID=28450 RepID=UPI0026DB9F42